MNMHVFHQYEGGFSLIELMVVVSIISVLSALSIPTFGIFQIRSARVEMQNNLNNIFTLAHSYHAENELYPNLFHYGVTTHSGNITNNYCAANEMGFSTTNCEKLRYVYSFSGTGGTGNGTDLSRRTYFTVAAENICDEQEGEGIVCTGYKPGTKFCRVRAGFDFYYWDAWTMYESKIVKPYLDSTGADSLQDGCIK